MGGFQAVNIPVYYILVPGCTYLESMQLITEYASIVTNFEYLSSLIVFDVSLLCVYFLMTLSVRRPWMAHILCL